MEEDFDILEIPGVELNDEASLENNKSLIVYNDDINTFENVIRSLIEVCEHSIKQAEQCAYLIHHKGKVVVKSGSFKKLKPMKDGLSERGLSVVIK
tara:strand:- start:43 stop:330 length:288 start_codon:yes stop_codon:yes gene_type:complete